MKLNYFLIFVGLSISFHLNAQDFRLEKADRYFENTYYSEAIPIYEEMLDKESKPESFLNLADSYYYTFQIGKAAGLYGRLSTAHPEIMDDLHYFQYVQTLKALGDYEKANQLEREKLLAENQSEAFSEELRYLENVKAIGKRFEMENLPLNTSVSEFGGVFYKGELVFASTRKNLGLFEKIFNWNSLPYLNLYSIPKDSLKTGTAIELFSENLTTRFHEANAVFPKDGNSVYFTRNNYLDGKKTTDENQVTQLQIYKAELVDGVWKNVVSLPINDNAFSNEHPALGPNGKTLYFSSNRPGGFGGFDLYKVNTENFKDVENLGPKINTKHKEQFPFVASNGDLYFSSDGHPGFGFLDVFVSKKTDQGFTKPDNVGLPVNSGYDDFAFMMDLENKQGFVSSNRPGGKGNDDIYAITQTKPLIIEDCHQLLVGTVVDEVTGELLPGSKVVLSQAGKPIDSQVVSEDASFSFKMNCEENYLITATKPNYRGDSLSLKTGTLRKKEHEAVLKLLSLEIIAKRKKEAEAEQKRIAETKLQAAIIAKKKAMAIAEKAETAAKKAEKERKKEAAKRKAAQEKAHKKRIAEVVEKEEAIVKENGRYMIKTEPIYFDYDLWYIRKESREVLGKVISLMNKYPGMTLEIGTHTDVRGSLEYNEELSQKRSNSVMEYFEGQDIDAKRIVAKGYGESRPIIKCVPPESCNEQQHEINRRCEFTILSFGEME